MKKRNIVEEVRAGLEEYAGNPDALTGSVKAFLRVLETEPEAVFRAMRN
jgi:hypothetical protein